MDVAGELLLSVSMKTLLKFIEQDPEMRDPEGRRHELICKKVRAPSSFFPEAVSSMRFLAK
jgi:hypothetical protein